MPDKNWCQNPKCPDRETGRYHRITNTFRSKYAAHDRADAYWLIGKYFCSHTCAQTWLTDHIEMIFDRKILPPKIIERKSVPAEEYDSHRSHWEPANDYNNKGRWVETPIKAHRVVGSDNT